MGDLERIQESLVKWKAKLGLSDWDIKVCFRDARDMDQCPAKTLIQEGIQTADIRLLSLNDRQVSDPGDADPELDLVHELVHIRLWAIDPKVSEGALHICREQAIEWIAKALISSLRER